MDDASPARVEAWRPPRRAAGKPRPQAWRAATAALVEAYAAVHGYDFYFADIHDCPRGPTWCQKLSVRALMAERHYDWRVPRAPARAPPGRGTAPRYVALDEDCFFADFRTPLDAFLAHLATPRLNKDDRPLPEAVRSKQLRTSRGRVLWPRVGHLCR